MEGQAVFLLCAAMSILGGLGIVCIGVYSRTRDREMLHRERLAMIERGLVPPPESDPARFQRFMVGGARLSSTGMRYRSAGITLIGFGVALTMLLTFTAGRPGVGIGIGGAFACLGIAFLVNSTLEGRDAMASSSPEFASANRTVGERGNPSDGPHA